MVYGVACFSCSTRIIQVFVRERADDVLQEVRENFGFEAAPLCVLYEGGMPIKDYFDELNRIILFMLLLDTVMEAAM